MGLLSEPEGGGGAWTRAVSRWSGAVGAASWLAAVVWLVALSHPALNNRTYFSENALLPGLVRSELPLDHLAERIHKDLLHELQDKYAESEEVPVAWLIGKMAQMRLDTYVHNFTLQYPLQGKQVWSGQNVYGVVRGSGLEALVVSVPFRPLLSTLPGSTAGLAVMLAFAQHAREQQYWAKDIIFLVTQHEQLGMQAWLEAYHAAASAPAPAPSWTDSLAALHDSRSPSPHTAWLQPGELPARFGHIQAIVNLDISSPDIKYLVVRGEGINGAACNLDLVNLVHRLCDKADLPHSHTRDYYTRPTSTQYLKSLLRQIVERAGGAPTGNAGLAQRYGVEGVTLEGGGGGGEAARLGGAGWRRLLLVLEGTMRSLNNLLERFHQSFFLYLTVHSDRFVSIGQYMVVVCVACGGLVVRALGLCLSAPTPRLTPLLINWLVLHAASLFLMLSVELAPSLGAQFGLPTEASILWWSAGACAVLGSACWCVPAPRGSACVCLVELACVSACISLLSPAAGLLLALVYAPPALLLSEAASRARRRLAAACCLLLHPLLLLYAALSVYAALTLGPDWRASLDPFVRALSATQQALTFSLIDYRIYGNWVWTWWCWLMPVWNLLLQVATTAYPLLPHQPHTQ